MKLPTLYRSDSKNKIREWSIEIITDEEYPFFVVTHGLQGGLKQQQTTIIKEGKNKGKSNETTAIEQCTKEANALWLKQKDKGYRETLDNLDEVKQYLPMLAYTFEDYKHKVKYPALIQPKLDGTRCIAVIKDHKVTFLSRKGKPITTMGHIERELEQLEDCVLDGELYNHDMKFDKIIGAIKRDTKNDDSELIQYHVYDIVDINEFFIQRYAKLRYLLIDFPVYFLEKSFKYIKLVETFVIGSEQQALSYRDEFISKGYEGAMYRSTNSYYKINGRSKDLLKLKKWQDAEFEIVNGTMDKLGECVFECMTKSGDYFSVKMEGTHEDRVDQYQDLDCYIGKMMTVKFFELTKDGIPRFPVGLRIREDI